MNNQDKIFVDGWWCKRRHFDNGGHIDKISVEAVRFLNFMIAQGVIPNTPTLQTYMGEISHQKFYMNINIQSSIEPRYDDKGNELRSASLDTWKPQQQQAPQQQQGYPQQAPQAQPYPQQAQPYPQQAQPAPQQQNLGMPQPPNAFNNGQDIIPF